MAECTKYVVVLRDEENQRIGVYSAPLGYPLPGVKEVLLHGSSEYQVLNRSFAPEERAIFLQCKKI